MKSVFFDEKIVESLTKTEKIIIKLAEENPQFFYQSNLKSLANKTQSSITLISNLAKKLSFSSFKEMQFHVYYLFLNSAQISNKVKNKQKTDKNKLIIEQLYKYYHNSLVQTLELVDLEKIQDFACKIIESKKIFIYGAGSSSIGASELAINLQKLGLNSVSFRDFHNFLLVSVQSQALKILFSKSCKTKEINFVIKKFIENNDNFIVITAKKQIDIPKKNLIFYQTLEQKNRFISISSKINQQFISDVIFFSVANLISEQYEENYKKNLEILKEWNE
ncbi:MurR/RpiR family transcriptional regulator [Mesomycoplasma ovipneumoniae]|uniref:MurR/RpiR family transcriptional regulator n=1 Tax=Mesomycoplasma ovipneumoniae TaxID=29562 RepID=A0AAW6Q8P2_9BACT|nr:MurR/RpiR family transcriptional regulator [Mesomycoplasma ovipneumoniae]MDF9627763.1 MurR/RpiR family transcriptional regulator [Mesomycoplasma ovipneumoniae]MDO4157852.1 MurR/RpiR family transcriptional regulator [Mesomycoplasma ovipneumoniae]MDO4158787.1 MurR/RpiR family transcriptional regulator [Mesomycoplasma ovipneumoniae]MDO6822111.1 MurR/RpiR family transcriptional regulator [Mesomycoplasma ovipneumoniae]MDO6855953.1 MurR/RpiR family transcriptional regulator [Mesomycoplasma ovipne